MNLDELISSLRNEVSGYIGEVSELDKLDEAIVFACKYYKGIKHYDDSDYVLHALRTAIILAELHSDMTTVISGLLHWLVGVNEEVTLELIEENFGSDVKGIVENVAKINKLRLKGEDESSAIYLRKILVGLSNDVRVIIIKLAGRLDNLRYVYTKPSDEQRQKCISTKNVLIPIAHRLGINYIKSELEDLYLKYMHPVEYEDILKNLNASYEELNRYLEEMKYNLSFMLKENGIVDFRIKGRVKSVHSLYEKLEKGKRWSEIYDILALRIIVKSESECYLAIGLIHSKYRPIPKRFKDYIAKPKENMYQSLHTGVIGPNGNVFEVQIRTEEMDEIAERGVASHWSYKEHGTKAIQNLMEQKLELFRDSIEVSDDSELVSDFNEIFVESMIYVYTPMGDVIELPDGSTPVDFAYMIHSRIGDTLVGAIVNDQIVPIDYKLKTDDIVKIKTSENSTPKKEWLNFVKTTQAKSKIKSFFSKKDKETYIERGEELLIKEIKRRKLSQSEVLTEDNIAKILKELKLKDYDELKLSIGSLRYTAKYVLGILYDDKSDASDNVLGKITSSNSVKKDYKNLISVAGCDDVLVSIASCCTPILGDDIVGFITRGNGIVVHKKNCANIKGAESRLIDVSWNNVEDSKYCARILIKTNNINNNLLDIVTKSSQRNLNIEKIDTHTHNEVVDYELLVDVPNTETLDLFMSDLKSLPFVKDVERIVK